MCIYMYSTHVYMFCHTFSYVYIPQMYVYIHTQPLCVAPQGGDMIGRLTEETCIHRYI